MKTSIIKSSEVQHFDEVVSCYVTFNGKYDVGFQIQTYAFRFMALNWHVIIYFA